MRSTAEKKCIFDVTSPHFARVVYCSLWQYRLWSFQTGYTKLERFLHKNQRSQRKLLNFENWTNGEPQYSSLQKSEFVKLIILFFHYFWCQNWDQWHKMSGKNTHVYFFYFRFKNKRVWAEKIRKKTKKFQKPKKLQAITLTSNSH